MDKDIISEIYFKKKVENGIEEIEKGEYLSHEDVMKRFEKSLV